MNSKFRNILSGGLLAVLAGLLPHETLGCGPFFQPHYINGRSPYPTKFSEYAAIKRFMADLEDLIPKVPPIPDGISTADAMIAAKLCPAAIPYMIMAHCSAEPGHRAMLEMLGKKPLLELGLRLGEGSGGALAMPILDSAAAILREMATFRSAAVSGEGNYRK